MHDGTVRDLCFLEDTLNKSSLLISGGAGDCKIYVTDCATRTPFQALSGHSGHVLTLYSWGGATFVSGSQDKTVRFWDLRTRGCVNMVTPATVPGSRVGIRSLLPSYNDCIVTFGSRLAARWPRCAWTHRNVSWYPATKTVVVCSLIFGEVEPYNVSNHTPPT